MRPLILVSVLGVMMIGGSGAGSAASTPSVSVVKVDAKPSTFTFVAPGSTVKMNVTATYSDGTSRLVTKGVDGTLYESSAPSIVAVNANGVLTAKAYGEATITVTHNGRKTTSLIKVEKRRW